jgi:hypothetical protein
MNQYKKFQKYPIILYIIDLNSKTIDLIIKIKQKLLFTRVYRKISQKESF